MKKTLVSIVTVTFNSEETIEESIVSVLNQTYDHVEYIIIDGASTDSTLKIAKKYKDVFKKKGYSYRIFSEPDAGIYDAMNKGISICRGEIIGLLNSDDWYEEDAIENVVKYYVQKPFDMIWGNVRLKNMLKTDYIKKARIKKYITTRNWHHASTFITSSVYKKYKYNTNGLYSDFDLWLKIRQSGYKITTIDKILVNTRITGVSHDKKIKNVYNRMKEKYTIYRKNGYSRLYIFESVFHEITKFIFA